MNVPPSPGPITPSLMDYSRSPQRQARGRLSPDYTSDYEPVGLERSISSPHRLARTEVSIDTRVPRSRVANNSLSKNRPTTVISIYSNYEQPVHVLHKKTSSSLRRTAQSVWRNIGTIEPQSSIDVIAGMSDLIKVMPQDVSLEETTCPIIEITSLLDNEAFCFGPGQIQPGKCPDKGSVIVQKVKDQLTQIDYGGVSGIIFFSVLAVLVICLIVAMRAWNK